MAKDYVKHLIECNCILPQYQNRQPPIFHKFVVFSLLDDNGFVIPSYAQCNHCGAIHKVLEVFTSKLLPKESLTSLPSIAEIKECLPEKYVNILSMYNCDLHSWQEVQFILDNELWGRRVILTREEVDNSVTGKVLLILSESMLKVDSYSIGDDDENE